MEAPTLGPGQETEIELWAERAAGAGAVQGGWAGTQHGPTRAITWSGPHSWPSQHVPASYACGLPAGGGALGWKAAPEGTLASGDPPPNV